MKRFFNKNKISFISFSILMIWLFIESCKCYKEGAISDDPLIMFYHLLKDMNLSFVQILAPVFVIVPSIYMIHKELHTGTIKMFLTRISYKKYMLIKYLEVIKKIWILPMFVCTILVISCLLTKSVSFGSGFELYGWISSPNIKDLNELPFYMVTYLIVILLHSILYANVGLLCTKKNSNFLVTIILSYIMFIALDIFMEVLIGNLFLAKILNIHNITDSLNLFNIWVYDNVISLPFMIFYSLFLVIVSCLVVLIRYRNKEGVIIESEG